VRGSVQITQGSPTIDRKSELLNLIVHRFFCDETMAWSLDWPALADDEDITGGFERYKRSSTATRLLCVRSSSDERAEADRRHRAVIQSTENQVCDARH
jgi:hypothetical protein